MVGSAASQLRFLAARLLLLPVLAFLPARVAFGAARLRGRRRYSRLGLEIKDRMGREVEAICGPVGEARVDAILQEHCEILSCDEMDPYLSLRLGRRGFDRIAAIEGLHHLEAATRAGGGAILFSAHFGGGYPLLATLGARGYRLYGLAAPIDRLPFAHRLTFELRLRLMGWAGRGGVLFTDHPAFGHEVFARLREGALVYLLLDVPPPPRAKRTVEVELFGRPCRLPSGILDLAAKSGVPVLPFFVYYKASHLRRVVIGAPVEFIVDPDREVARRANLRRCLERIEEAIVQAPSHWMLWGAAGALWSAEGQREAHAGRPS